MFSKTRSGGNAPASTDDAQDQPEPPRTAPTPATEAPARAGAAAMPAPAPATEARAGASVLLADLELVGSLRTSGEVRIEGVVDGDVEATRLVLGESTRIKGELTAKELAIRGHVTGKISALTVHLASTARVEGEIRYRSIAIDAGARFDGTLTRSEGSPGTEAASSGDRRQTGAAATGDTAQAGMRRPRDGRTDTAATADGTPDATRAARDAAPAKNA